MFAIYLTPLNIGKQKQRQDSFLFFQYISLSVNISILFKDFLNSLWETLPTTHIRYALTALFRKNGKVATFTQEIERSWSRAHEVAKGTSRPSFLQRDASVLDLFAVGIGEVTAHLTRSGG